MNILVTNYANDGENVLVYSNEINAKELAMALTYKGIYFDEIYVIKDEECQYYCYEPLWADKGFENGVKSLSQKFLEKFSKDSEEYKSLLKKI